MQGGLSADVQVSLDVEATADWSDILTNLITLYTDPWFVMSIAMTLGCGMIAYLCLKAYRPQTFWVTMLLIILVIELISGYVITQYLVDQPEVDKYAMITGFNAALAYWLIDYFSGKFGLVRVQAAIRLRTVKVVDGKLVLGGPINFKGRSK